MQTKRQTATLSRKVYEWILDKITKTQNQSQKYREEYLSKQTKETRKCKAKRMVLNRDHMKKVHKNGGTFSVNREMLPKTTKNA